MDFIIKFVNEKLNVHEVLSASFATKFCYMRSEIIK